MQTTNVKINFKPKKYWIECIDKYMPDTRHIPDFSVKGSLYKLEDIINQNKINIDIMGIMSTLSKYVKQLETIEENVFKAFYWRQMSVFDIRELYSFNSNEHAYEVLSTATSKYISILEHNFGLKK